jgi:REP element-mobilizing transposase RayT
MGAFTRLSYHVIFGTRYRKPVVHDDFRERLYEYIGGVIRGINGSLIMIGGIEDHIHLLANWPPTLAVANVIRDVKANSSRWLNDLAEFVGKFEWQKGYAAFTVSYSQIEMVRTYIMGQKEHHRKTTFEEEYMEFLRRHDIKFEHRYLFEGEHHG